MIFQSNRDKNQLFDFPMPRPLLNLIMLRRLNHRDRQLGLTVISDSAMESIGCYSQWWLN